MNNNTARLCLIVTAGGVVYSIYDEALDFASLGEPVIRRASHVEPDAEGKWHADLTPVGGPVLGPCRLRSQALAAERAWLSGQLHRLRD